MNHRSRATRERRVVPYLLALALATLASACSNTSNQTRAQRPGCSGDNDCSRSAGRVCINGQCQACRSNADCDDNQSCVSNQCRTLVAQTAPDSPVAAQAVDGGRCFSAVYFAFDDDQIAERGQRSLRSAAECLARERSTRYVLVGRADPRGTSEYNLALGERRARAVQRVLAALGVDANRLVVSSEGSEGATGTDESGWQQDRRVDDRALASGR
ncbi:MAG: OmpA family protein [Myxococcales bacterium]|nr:OmpA family protein [Myxococcales bacterium]